MSEPKQIKEIKDDPSVADRFAFLIDDDDSPTQHCVHGLVYDVLSCSVLPEHHQHGVSQWSMTRKGDFNTRKVGKTIEWSEVPSQVQEHVKSRLEE